MYIQSEESGEKMAFKYGLTDFRDKNFFLSARKICEKAQKSSSTLSEALQKCEGLFPTYALKIFELVDIEKTKSLLQSPGEYSEVSKQSSFLLSQWNFIKNSTNFLKEKIDNPLNSTLLLGVPSLKGVLTVNDLLVDRLVAAKDRQLKMDIFSFAEKYQNLYDTIVIDPPWSFIGYRDWITVATQLLKDDGTVLFPLLGNLTRPSALEDRSKILRYCEALGYDWKMISTSITYDLPSFEAEILSRNDIPKVVWKTADLIELKLIDKVHSEQVFIPSSAWSPKSYMSHVIGDVLIEGASNGAKRKGALLEVPREGPYMESSSSRDQGNLNSNIFTSTGFRFYSADVSKFFDLLVSTDEQTVCTAITDVEVRKFFLEALNLN